MYLSSLPTLLSSFATQVSLGTTVLLIAVLIVLEFLPKEEKHVHIAAILYPFLTVLGILLVVTVGQYVK